VSLTATAVDSGSGVASVTFQRAPTGTGTWTNICAADATEPFSCNFNTGSLGSGTYDIRALATDGAANQGISSIETATVDNVRPTAVGLLMANTSGGIAGKAEPGDGIGLTYSEAMDPASILAGWDGSATTVTLRFGDGGKKADDIVFFDGTNTTRLELGTVNLIGKGYVTADATFTATMQRSQTSILFVLGAPSNAGSFTTGESVRAWWEPSSAATDLAGNLAMTTRFTQPAPALQF
jgi:chitinase